MSERVDKQFSPLLAQWQLKRWQQFEEKHPDEFSVLSNKQLADFKEAIALSDFIFDSVMQLPTTILASFSDEGVYDFALPDYASLLANKLEQCQTEADLHKALRQFRTLHMVNIAIADLVLNIPLKDALLRLTALADSLILGALNWLSKFCHQQWGEPKNSNGETLPLLVYGMGKLGGGELNFSSDIDLIFAYPEAGETQGARRSIDNQVFFTRLAQKLITALNQPTADGFVYRVDMRLRPFGESGPLVLTFNAMEDYYQEQGRDWERYAMLKARLIGEGKYHKRLSVLLKPFVYRRYIDFSVIDSLRRMKAMIAQEVRRKQLANNIKLGAGGIREVEFIVQVFQLIRGGRVQPLQERSLLTVLPRLVEHNEITESSKQVLESAYCFLRRVENIIQAIADKQTQTLPDNELDQQRILHALRDHKFSDWQEFLVHLNRLMDGVHQEFVVLIGEESPNHQTQDQQWVTLWDSQWDDEESIEWISNIEHCEQWQVAQVWQLLKHFRQDITKCSIGTRGRQVLDKLVPLIMSHLVEQKADETALSRVLIILNKIVTRTAYLELMYENEGALKHLIKLCQVSQWVAEHIAKYPILLDELIDPKLLNNPPKLSSYDEYLREHLLRVPEDDLEAQMDMLRQFKQAQQLRIAVADIVGVLPITKVSDHLTALAQSIVNEVVNMAWQQMALRYGVPHSLADGDQKAFSVIGYGKMGGFELGYGSDLDLVFIHNCDLNDMTNGKREVPASQFYAKLAQRMMHIFNTRMATGILYELDMRLRPSGNSGVLVVHIDTFENYQNEEAWTWEHQALVRARAIYGHPAIVERFNNIRKQVLTKPRDKAQLAKDVVEMRDKMQQHLDKSDDNFSDIKQSRGGLVDIEFLVQYLVLANYCQHLASELFSDNIRILEQLCQWQVIEEVEKISLITQYCQLRDFGHQQVLQNQESMMNNTNFSEHAQVVKAIFDRYLN